MRQRESKVKEILLPLLCLIILTIPFYIWNIDIIWQEFFYKDGEWFLKNAKIFELLYDFGPVPAIISALGGLILYILGFFVSGAKQYRKTGLYLFLFLLIGSGIVINAVLKEYWGRPRPRQIIEFGGEAEYIPPAKKGKLVLSSKAQKMVEAQQGAVGWDKLRNLYKLKGKYNSFPAGHASVGFFMMFPYFLYRKKSQGKKWLYGGVIYGLLMGIGRNIQGGHFLSDVIWAGFLMYFTGLFLSYIMKINKR